MKVVRKFTRRKQPSQRVNYFQCALQWQLLSERMDKGNPTGYTPVPSTGYPEGYPPQTVNPEGYQPAAPSIVAQPPAPQPAPPPAYTPPSKLLIYKPSKGRVL